MCKEKEINSTCLSTKNNKLLEEFAVALGVFIALEKIIPLINIILVDNKNKDKKDN